PMPLPWAPWSIACTSHADPANPSKPQQGPTMNAQSHPLAIVTGASSGIGFELARYCAINGFELLIAADEPEIHPAAEVLRSPTNTVDAVETDLSTLEGVDELLAALDGRPVAALLANAGR